MYSVSKTANLNVIRYGSISNSTVQFHNDTNKLRISGTHSLPDLEISQKTCSIPSRSTTLVGVRNCYSTPNDFFMKSNTGFDSSGKYELQDNIYSEPCELLNNINSPDSTSCSRNTENIYDEVYEEFSSEDDMPIETREDNQYQSNQFHEEDPIYENLEPFQVDKAQLAYASINKLIVPSHSQYRKQRESDKEDTHVEMGKSGFFINYNSGGISECRFPLVDRNVYAVQNNLGHLIDVRDSTTTQIHSSSRDEASARIDTQGSPTMQEYISREEFALRNNLTHVVHESNNGGTDAATGEAINNCILGTKKMAAKKWRQTRQKASRVKLPKSLNCLSI